MPTLPHAICHIGEHHPVTSRALCDSPLPLMGTAAKRGRQPARGAALGMGALGFTLALLSASWASGKHRRSPI